MDTAQNSLQRLPGTAHGVSVGGAGQQTSSGLATFHSSVHGIIENLVSQAKVIPDDIVLRTQLGRMAGTRAWPWHLTWVSRWYNVF